MSRVIGEAPLSKVILARTFDGIIRTALAEHFDGDEDSVQDAIRRAIMDPNDGWAENLAELIADYYSALCVTQRTSSPVLPSDPRPCGWCSNPAGYKGSPYCSLHHQEPEPPREAREVIMQEFEKCRGKWDGQDEPAALEVVERVRTGDLLKGWIEFVARPRSPGEPIW